MVQLSQAIDSLAELGNYILSNPQELQDIVRIAQHNNGWFDEKNCQTALQSIAKEFLQKDKLEAFVSNYPTPTKEPKSIGLILAGNIPMVGFHDVLCVLLSGHNAKVKLSSKDDKLMRAILMKLQSINDQFKHQITIVERLSNFDAVIATGSDNSARYFEEYFGKYPHIIRKNRTSIAILKGNETENDYLNLGKDIFQYYGLGCRNVSMVFVPKGYEFENLLNGLKSYASALNNSKYKNNFDYNLTLLLINKMPHIQGEAVIFTEDKNLNSRIAVVHYQEYDNQDEINNFIIEHQQKIQVIIGEEFTPFGTAQSPRLQDYADNVDTMQFLAEL